MQDSYNIIPVTLAVLLHVLVFGSMFVAFDLNRQAAPPMQLAIRATLVTDELVTPPPRVPEPEPEPVEPEPEPELEPEPEELQPDPEEEARKRAEEQKLIDDRRREQERLDRIRREEADRKAAEDKARLERESQERRDRLEQQRQEDEDRQRRENELERQRQEQQARADEITAEEEALAAQNSTEAQIYQSQMVRAVQSNWNRPGTAREGLSCLVAVTQLSTGVVTSARVLECNGDDIVKRSIENAVLKASPLPTPSNPLLFLRSFQFEFKYDG